MHFREHTDPEEYLQSLIDSGILVETDTGKYIIKRFKCQDERGQGGINTFNILHLYSKETRIKIEGHCGQSNFLQQLRPLFCTTLFLNSRLVLLNRSANFEYDKIGPSSILQVLSWDKALRELFCDEIENVFQRAVWVDNTLVSQLAIRVAESIEMPKADDRIEPQFNAQHRTIDEEGDGFKAYASICATILLERRSLCLIDEPEMCLHPPQAHSMGRFIGKHSSEETCTIISTHSSHVLRGILETRPKTKVIRLTRNGTNFQSQILNPDILEGLTSKPGSRSEAVLEGLLSHGVVLCEAEGDRIVYESTYRTLKSRRLDIRFVPSGGTGGFADPLKLYKALGVPCAVIADIDFLAKDGELRKVLKAFGVEDTKVRDLCSEARETISQIRESAVPIDPDKIQTEIASLAKKPIDLQKDDSRKVRGKLQKIINQLRELNDFKQKGIESIPKIL